MIDVVFLLLVFFMLAARFGATDAAVRRWRFRRRSLLHGPPRLVEVRPDGSAPERSRHRRERSWCGAAPI